MGIKEKLKEVPEFTQAAFFKKLDLAYPSGRPPEQVQEVLLEFYLQGGIDSMRYSILFYCANKNVENKEKWN